MKRRTKRRSKAKTIKLYKDTLLFHGQWRVGKDGKPIWIKKFRTMKRGAHADFYKRGRRHQQHLTKFGKIIRKRHLDELPQFKSWLRGDLEFVGLRPLPRKEYRELEPELKEMYDEFGPGLLGLEYACRHFPPSTEELVATVKKYYEMRKKSKVLADRTFAQRILKNMWGKEMKGDIRAQKPKTKNA